MPDIQTIASILAAPQPSADTYLTKEEERRLLAFQQLQKMASSTDTPIYSKTAGLMKLATGALGGYLEGKTERDAQAAQAQNSALIASLFGGTDPPPPMAPVSPPAIDTSDVPASPVSAPPMGALPGFGPVADSSQQDAILADAQKSGVVPPPPTPLGAETLRDFDAMKSRPDAPPAAPPLAPAPVSPSPMSPAVPPGGLDQGTVFNPSLPGGLSEGATVVPNAAVKPVPIGPNGEVSSLAPSGPFANDPVPRPPADIPNPMPQYANAISGIESGGRYDLIGPVTRGGDRAIGKYQVMASNVPEWTKEALGKSMTPAEFRADPQAQEAVFAHKFGSYVQKYGPEGAAKAWFAGEDGMKNPNARDVLGTSVSSYARQFRNNLGPAGAQVASLDPRAGVAPAGAPPAQSGPTPQRLAQALQNPPQVNLDAQRKALAVRLLADPRTPSQIRALIAQQMTPQKPIEVNGRLVDPRTFKVLADFSDPKTAVVGDTVVDVGKGRAIYQGQPKPTTDIQNYQFSQQTPGFADYQERLKRAGAAAITNDMRGENEFSKVAGKQQATRFDELASEAPAAKQMMSDVATLQQLGRVIHTGKGAQVRQAIGPVADALGIKVDGLSDIQAYDSIVNRVAPTLRVKGSGAQSDFELKNFLKSLPSLGNTPRGNEIIAQTMQGLQANKLKAAEIGANALTGKISRDEAEKQLRELPDPMEGWRAFQREQENAKPATTTTPDRAALEAEARRRGLIK